jgi:hypothetical protein
MARAWRGPIGSPGVAGEDLSPAAAVTNTTGLPTVMQGRFGGMGRLTPQMPGVAEGVPGKPTQLASGNPDVSTDPSVAPQKAPYGGAPNTQAIPQFGAPRPLQPGYQETAKRGGFRLANDKLITYDRHPIMNQGTELSGRNSGSTDPPMDGPARPAMRLVQRALNWMQGNPLATQDQFPGENRPYSMLSPLQPNDAMPGGVWTNGKQVKEPGAQFVGEQGTGWSPVYGGTPGLWQPYGSYEGYTAGPVKGIQAPVEQGQPGDGNQKVWSGPPHGLHTQTYPDYSSTLGRYLAIPQMALPRQDRPANSTAAGQSYNQLVQLQGQTGTVPQNTNTNTGIQANRLNTRGWRGQRPGGRQV